MNGETRQSPQRLEDAWDLPSGWIWLSLTEVCVINPRRPAEIPRQDDHPTTFVPMRAVDEHHGAIRWAEVRPYGQVRSGYTFFAEGDVLFAKITPCMQNGKHAIAEGLIDGFGFGSTEFHVLRPTSNVMAKWVHYFLRQPAVLSAARAFFTGTVGQQRVGTEFFATAKIPIPPLPEQRRIVSILDEHLTAVEQARAAVEAQLDAATGLRAAYLREVLDGRAAQGWPVVSLAELGLNTRNGTYKPDSFYGDGVPILKMFNIGRLDGTWLLQRVDRVRLTPREFETYRLRRGDILVNRVNSRELVGKCAVVDHRLEGAVFESKNMRLRLNPKRVLPSFVATWLNSEKGRQQILSRMRAIVGQATINRSDLQSIEISLPILRDQQLLMNKLEETISTVRSLARKLAAQLETVKGVPASLLRRAFSGMI